MFRRDLALILLFGLLLTGLLFGCEVRIDEWDVPFTANERIKPDRMDEPSQEFWLTHTWEVDPNGHGCRS